MEKFLNSMTSHAVTHTPAMIKYIKWMYAESILERSQIDPLWLIISPLIVEGNVCFPHKRNGRKEDFGDLFLEPDKNVHFLSYIM